MSSARRLLYYFALPFSAIYIADFASKSWAQTLTSPFELGIFSFAFVKNSGAVMGLYSDVPQFILIVTLSTTAAFLFCLTFAIFHFLPSHLIALPLGLSFLISGIIGNATDRIRNGYVTDFVALQTGLQNGPYVNLADVAQWIAYILLIYALTFGVKEIWRPDENRKRLIINKPFQVRFCGALLLISLAITAILGIFSYTFIKYTVVNYGAAELHLEQTILRPFLLTFFSTIFTIMLFVGYLSLMLSHKIAGPIYAFERNVRESLAGKKKALKLRQTDAFKEKLEPLARDLADKL